MRPNPAVRTEWMIFHTGISVGDNRGIIAANSRKTVNKEFPNPPPIQREP